MTLDDLPVVATAIMVRHGDELLGVQFLPDGTPCHWDNGDELVPIHQLEWMTIPAPIRQVLLAAIKAHVPR